MHLIAGKRIFRQDQQSSLPELGDYSPVQNILSVFWEEALHPPLLILLDGDMSHYDAALSAAMSPSKMLSTTCDGIRKHRAEARSVQENLDSFWRYCAPGCLFVDVRSLAKYTTSDTTISTSIIGPTLLEWPESVILRPEQRDRVLERSVVLVVLALGEVSTWRESSAQGCRNNVSKNLQQIGIPNDSVAEIPGMNFFQEAMVPLFAGGQFNRLLLAQVSLLASMYMARIEQDEGRSKWLGLAAQALLPLLNEYGLLSDRRGWEVEDVDQIHNLELRETFQFQLKAKIILTAWCCLKFEKSSAASYAGTMTLSSVEHRIFVPWNPFTDLDRMLYDKVFGVCADREFSLLLTLLVGVRIDDPIGPLQGQ